MPRGEITGYIDVAQVTLYAFWIFFAGLVFWLRREDRREGYPLEAEAYGRLKNPDPVLVPRPKAFNLSSGETVLAPDIKVAFEANVPSRKIEPWPGAPYARTDANLTSGVGPGSWTPRSEAHDKTWDGHNRIVPLRSADSFVLHEDGPNPIGLPVLGADRQSAGSVSDVWFDRGESLVRYYEVDTGTGGKVLMPATFAKLALGAQHMSCKALLASQFSGIPKTKDPDSVTMMEEERIVAYFGAGTLYATPQRAEPIL